MASSRQLSSRQQEPMVPSQLPLGFFDDPIFGLDPFAAILPFAAGASRTDAGRHRNMALDVTERGENIEVQADIPGMNKDDIKVEVDNDIMTLSVEKNQEMEENKEEKGVKWHRSERSHTFMKRSIRLPEYADTENVSANYDNGVLKLTIPKKPVKESKQRIKIS